MTRKRGLDTGILSWQMPAGTWVLDGGRQVRATLHIDFYDFQQLVEKAAGNKHGQAFRGPFNLVVEEIDRKKGTGDEDQGL